MGKDPKASMPWVHLWARAPLFDRVTKEKMKREFTLVQTMSVLLLDAVGKVEMNSEFA